MKIQTECLPCLIKRIIFESELSTKDLPLKKETIKNALKYLSDHYDPNECSAVIATKIHKIVYKTLGDEDPYRLLKKKSNEIAISLVPKVEKLLKESDDPLRTIIVCSIVGNSMDFGIDGGSRSPEALIDTFEKKIEEGLGYDNYEKVKEYLLVSKNIALFTDNCGEIVFDKILCREIKNLNNNLKISLIVKGDPILSDATIKDTEELNFKEVVDEILTTECFAVGIDYKNITEKVKNVLSDSDLIICKGMANYECFSETDYKPIVYLMRTKCNPIAKSMNLLINKNIVKIYE